ncbi:MAG: hypothetical protein U0452_12860 [Anaerolineae bacterium]
MVRHIQLKRRSILFVSSLGAALMAAILFLTPVSTVRANDPQEVGVAPDGANALEFIGKIDQSGLLFQGYGYVTYIAGIPEDQMFTDPINHSEATARFTWASQANLTARSIVDNIFMLNAAGSTTIYFNETPAGDFADPASFASGTPIAVSSERWQNIVNVQAPDTAIATGGSQFTETSMTPFTLDNVEYQFGHVNLLLRFSYTGEGHRSDRVLPSSNFVIAGNAISGSGS